MAYRVGSGETGALGIQYDDRDRDAANVRNQATQINAQQASEARRLAAGKAAQDAAAAAQMYGDDKRYALGMNTIDANAKISGTAEDTRAHALRLEDMRQAPDIRKADEDRRRYDMEYEDGAPKRALEAAKVRGTMQYVDRFTGGGRGSGPSASPSMGGAMGGMAAGAGAAGVMDPTDHVLMADLSEADKAGMAFLGGDFGAYLQNSSNEKNAARERAEAKDERNRASQTALAEMAITAGDESGYQLLADASGGAYSGDQVRAARQPKRTKQSVLDVLNPMAAKFNNQDTQFFGDEPAEGAEEDLLHQVALLTEIFMREVRDPKQAEMMAWNALEQSLQTGDQGSDGLNDWGADRSKALMARRPGSSTAGAPVAGRSQLQNSANRSFSRTANPLTEGDPLQQFFANVGTRGF